MDLERQLQLTRDVIEAARLETAGARLGVAVHGVADPQHLMAGLPHGLDHARQALLDVLRAEAVNERETTRLVLRIQRRDETLQPGRIHRRADLHTNWIRDAAHV